LRYNVLMVFELFRWWYGPGWAQAAKNIRRWTSGVERSFSVIILLQTLFAPWRRIISVSGRGLDAKIQAMLDNLVSRIVGFFVRFAVVVTACFAIGGIFVLGVITVVAWPLIPLGIVYCIARSIIG
jgi:hypothetical protein